MEDKKCRLVLLVGKKHSGKTTFLQRIAEKLKKEKFKIAGFLAPSIYEGVFLLGYDLVDIQNGRRAEFAQRSRPNEPFKFSNNGLKFGQSILNSSETRKADMVIIDEFGPLELAGKGWRKDTDSLLENKKCLVVVRKELVENVRQLYSDLVCRVFPPVRKSIENIISLLKEQGENVDKEQIYQKIKKRSKDGQISCQQCFEVAKACDVALKQIGSICNEKKIKIRFCQMGCFE